MIFSINQTFPDMNNLIEWKGKNWYAVVRYPDGRFRGLLSQLIEELSENKNVSYTNFLLSHAYGCTNTLWTELQSKGYNPKKLDKPITTDSECAVISMIKCAGQFLNIPEVQNLSAIADPLNYEAEFRSAGFEYLKSLKYLSSPDYLYAGDILIDSYGYMAVNLSHGQFVREEA